MSSTFGDRIHIPKRFYERTDGSKLPPFAPLRKNKTWIEQGPEAWNEIQRQRDTGFEVPEEAFHKIVSYQDDILTASRSIRAMDVYQIAKILKAVHGTGGTVYIAGNGGSAANALHLSGHLDVFGFSTNCLVANPVSLTALSNDRGYEKGLDRRMFQGPRSLPSGRNVEDVLVVFSCSGRSKNVTRLASCFNYTTGQKGIGLIGDTYPDRSIEKRDLDPLVIVKSENYGVIEDVHSMIIHIVCELLRDMGLKDK